MRPICTILTLAIIVTSFSSCATKPDKIKPQYISPMTYSNLECEQVQREILIVNTRLAELTGQQKGQRTKDTVAVTAGLVLFWPALFFLMSDDEKQQISRLKGEYEALQHVAIEKNCPFAAELGIVEETAEKTEAEVKPKNKSKPSSRTSKGR